MLNRLHVAGWSALVVVSLAGCDQLLKQTAPSRVNADGLEVPANAKLLVDGARAAFGCALQAYITGAGLMTEEMEDTQLAAAAWDYDRRAWTTVVGVAYAESPCDVGQIFGVYRPVQVARYQADYALNVVKGFADADVADKATLVQTAALYAGYSYILLGEGFCTSAVSAPTEILTADGGAELSSADLFAAAEARFTEAIAGPDATLANAARVGRARARLNLAKPVGGAPNAAKLAEARADAVAVPAGFNYTVPYNAATSYSQNLLFRRQKDFLLYGVAPPYRDLTFAGVKDPRTAVTNTGLRGADAVSIVWSADKYASQSAPISLAKYQEAQLIIAEIDGGSAAVGIINALHDAVGLPHFDSSDPAAIAAQIIQERGREMFLEGHHFYDVRRLNLPLNPAAGTPYPIKGGTYGDQRCWPLPDVERFNNPKLRDEA
jgi:hypothetical protein